MHVALASLLCLLLAWHGLRKNSLAYSGAIAATFTGLLTFTHYSFYFSALLLAFYLSSSRLTKVKANIKKQLEEHFVDGGKRTATQVFSNSLTAVIICTFHHFSFPPSSQCPPQNSILSTSLILAYLAHYACCNGDTWASELGILSKSPPFLITTFKVVPPGTNGGVSKLGLLASAAGGLFIGVVGAVSVNHGLICPWAFDTSPYVVLPIWGAVWGLLGSLLDSVLGATLQKTQYNENSKKITADGRKLEKEEVDEGVVLRHVSGWDVLDNHQVNFVSSAVCAVVGGLVSYFWNMHEDLDMLLEVIESTFTRGYYHLPLDYFDVLARKLEWLNRRQYVCELPKTLVIGLLCMYKPDILEFL
ncbi:Transmembrane protein 19 [Nowakowskiella sp. JEL0407]|nr:Transmembrane protein 19 [Nowakowskiella sp. JEL0407]